MISEEKMAALRTATAPPASRKPTTTLAGLSEDELLLMRAEIDNLLPPQSMANMNMEQELVLQFKAVKRLQLDVIDDKDTPANQRAQVANAVAATLGQLVKMQADFYTSERFKAIEALMIRAMKTMPRPQAEKFISEYEALE